MYCTDNAGNGQQNDFCIPRIKTNQIRHSIELIKLPLQSAVSLIGGGFPYGFSEYGIVKIVPNPGGKYQEEQRYEFHCQK